MAKKINSLTKIIIILVLGTTNLNAQDTLKKEVQVVKPYEPTISDAFKMNHLPKIIDTVKIIPEITYTLQTHPVNVKYEVTPIKPAKMVGEPLTKLYNSHVKIGLGTKILPMIEGYVNSKRSKEYSLGAYYKLLNSMAKVNLDNNKRQFAGFSDNNINIFGKKFMENSVLNGQAGLKSNTRYFYGYNTQIDTTLNKEDIKQNYLNLYLKTDFKSTYVDSSHINYNFGAKLGYTKDKFQNNELAIKIAGGLDKIFTKEMIGINIGVEHYATSESLDSSNNTIIKINPWLGKFGDKWRVKAGVNIFSDMRGDNSKMYFFPVGSLEYDMANHYLIPYAGVGGELKVNNFWEIAKINPFTVPGTDVKNSDQKINLYGGIRGNFNSSTYYNFKIQYILVDDMPFFVNDFDNTDSIGNQFNVIYDDIRLLNYFGELSVTPSEKLMINAKINYNDYQMSTEAKAWHKPSLDITFTTRYNLQHKIILKADIMALGKRYAKIGTSGNIKELESVIDLNIGAEYRYSKLLSGFISLNNILNENYNQWNYFSSFGFNILMGITYSF